MATLNATIEYNLIYVFAIPDLPTHNGLLKIGKTTVVVDEDNRPMPNSKELNDAAHARIRQETNTAGISYKLLYTELAYYKDENGKGKKFDDHSVFDVLTNSGYPKHIFDNSTADEWFPVSLDIVKQAIKAVKEERQAITAPKHSIPSEEISFREEQNDAIRRTIEHFKVGDQYLWNAKMRFGKTLCALQVVQQMDCRRTLILTHRPVVRNGWFEDYDKIEFNNFQRATKKPSDGSSVHGGIGESLENMEKDLLDKNKGTHYIYFISMQDLRGSKESGGKFDKNNEVFRTEWDLVIIDEAHEGTTTKLGKAVIAKLQKRNPKMLYLSGTPYNILDLFTGEECYTWDYVMEQKAKNEWDEKHPGIANPYEGLPRLNMCTYSLGKAFENYAHAENDYFNFHEFFRTWTGDAAKDGEVMPASAVMDDFVHKDDVRAFLDLLTREDPQSHYPFANETYRNYFQHSFWVLPSVKAAAALSAMLKQHPVFGQFGIVNVAGEGNTLATTNAESDVPDNDTIESVNKNEAELKEALSKVNDAIAKHHRTITLSCGRLTTGVTVPQWTAVFMLAGSYSTKAATYMQTIFRVQSPAKDGTIKRECYAFDFAPDRTVTVVEDYLNVGRKLEEGLSGSEAKEKDKGHHGDEHALRVQNFLHFCPIIAINGSEFVPFDTTSFIKQVNHAIAEQIYRKGFSDARLFMGFNNVNKEDLATLVGIESMFGSKNTNKPMSNEGGIMVNNQGMLDDGGDGSSNKKKDTQDTSSTASAGTKKEKKPRNTYLESLRRYQLLMTSIAKRFPLLLFGAMEHIDREHWSLSRFVRDMDAEDWKQFMPKGFDKEKFLEIEHLFNNDYFISATQMILEDTRLADQLPVEERVIKMAHILQRFHYPDKETVLTPWRVVNLHMTTTIGGYSFYTDDSFEKEATEPHLVRQDGITDDVFAADSRLLEINSKSGVYPLWLAYTLFRYRCSEQHRPLSEEEQLALWDKVLSEQLFVLCKTEMARRITMRVLAGYRHNVITHCKHEKDLLDILKDEELKNKLVKRLKKYSYWGINDMPNKNLFFRAVVGNPPYQADNHWQLYPNFYLLSQKLGQYSSLIFPTGWQLPKNANNLKLLNTKDIKTDKQIVRIDNRQNIFPGVAGAEWVNIVFWEKDFDNGLEGKQRLLTNGENEELVTLHYDGIANSKPQEIKDIVSCIKARNGFSSLQASTSVRKPYGFSTDVLGDFAKYHLRPFQEEKKANSDIKIYCKGNEVRYIPKNYDIPSKTAAFQKWKVLVPYAWGNMSKNYLGGAYADIIIAAPNEICLETYLESGCFDDKDTAVKHAKYLMTKFARAALFSQKVSQHSTTAWGDVPVQDYSEHWWNESIEQINLHLFDKYNVPPEIRDYVNEHIQPRSEANIRNLE